MSIVTPVEPTTVEPTTPTLDVFYEHVRYNNPFAISVVPASLQIEDAGEVHQKPYARLVGLASEAAHQQAGLGVMLWGEAGIGKSHLLARLKDWADPNHKHAIFVPLPNLQAAPEQLPRSLLRCVLSVLTEGRTSRLYETQLYRLVNAAIRHALQNDCTRTRSWNEAESAYDSLVDELCSQNPAQAAVLNRQVFAVLFRFFRSAYLSRQDEDDGQTAALAGRWLSGDYLDVEEAKSLGLVPGPKREEGAALTDDMQIQHVLIALALMASYRQRPLILCFDQVDALEPEQFGALARFLHVLLDSAKNLLVITSGVRTSLVRWQADGIIPHSTWDRLAQHEIELQRVSVSEARQIVQVRLERFQETFMVLDSVKERIQEDYLFPLGEKWADEFLTGKIEVRPRDVINWAREGWRRHQDALKQVGGLLWLKNWEGGQSSKDAPLEPSEEELQALIDAKVELKLQDHKRRRQQEPQTLPPDGDNLSGLLDALLQRCLGADSFPSLRKLERLVQPKYGQRPPYDLMLRQQLGTDNKEMRSGLLCLVVSNRTSMAAYLKRLVKDTQPPERLFLITDERRQLTPATAGHEYLEKLHQRHGERFVRVTLTFDQYAELDALQATIGLARSGDLEIELPGGHSRRVAEVEVAASHLRQRRYARQPLLQLLLGPEQQSSLTHQTHGEDKPPEPSPGSNRNGTPSDIQVTLWTPTSNGTSQHDPALAARALVVSEPQQPGSTEEDTLELGQGAENGRPVTLPCPALPTHVAVVGAAGSGKTWLAKVLAEEAIVQGVPVLAIDPQGDLVQFLKRRDPGAIPPQQLPRYQQFWRLAEPRVFTPGSSHGIRLCLSPIRLPQRNELDNLPAARRDEEFDSLLGTVAGNLVNAARSGGDTDCQRAFVLQLLHHLLNVRTDRTLGLADVADAVMQPEAAGLADADRFIKKSERENLGRKLNALLSGPSANLFSGGQPLDLGYMLRPSATGKVPLNVIYLNALPDDEQKQLFVAALAAEVYRWMVTEGSRGAKPQVLIYLDEARDYIPAGSKKPPAKEPLLRLFAQGRKYGVACLMCTQSPRSVDYNIFGNCSTKIIGRLESKQDVERVAEWFGKEGPTPPWLQDRKGAVAGTFVGRWPAQSAEWEGLTWKSRCLFSWHEGAWSAERLEQEIRLASVPAE